MEKLSNAPEIELVEYNPTVKSIPMTQKTKKRKGRTAEPITADQVVIAPPIFVPPAETMTTATRAISLPKPVPNASRKPEEAFKVAEAYIYSFS